jgi:hypothetical protein
MKTYLLFNATPQTTLTAVVDQVLIDQLTHLPFADSGIPPEVIAAFDG